MIKLLDKATIDKIAAGEVIERPCSVVKELLENSIDAGSSSITVEIKDGGLSFIRVTDNGSGIPKEQVRTAYMRHATSKISSAEDLSGIMSLGFRGEALSTIAAVSQTEMITKTAGELTGIKYTIHGGTEIDYMEIGVPDGTTIIVRNLFYNTPARKKFLKTPLTEGSYIQDLVLKIALSHPEISVRLISNGQTKLDTPGNGKIKDTIYQLFGRDITSNLIEINYKGDNIQISGYIGKPFISRGNRGMENYFVNKRYIKSSVVNRSIEEGYKTFVMQHKFPFTVLYIELAPDSLDVNVHPTKMEFKYNNEKELFEVITKTIKDALTHREIIPKEEDKTDKDRPDFSHSKPAEPFEEKRSIPHMPKPNHLSGKYNSSYSLLESLKKDNSSENSLSKTPDVPDNNLAAATTNGIIAEPQAGSKSDTAFDNTNAAINILNEERKPYVTATLSTEKKEEKASQTSLFEDNFLTKDARKSHRLIGQVFDTYWLIQYENNLYIMDQHAAHEKVRYEELMRNFKNKQIYSQQLMPPMIITVSYNEREAILQNYDLFMNVGYDIEEFGGNEFKINAVPDNLYGLHGREMFMEFVGSLINNSGYMSNDIFIKRLSTMACKSAIKGNTKISFAEADALIDELLKLDNPYTCPHGRPTIISISEEMLEKKFKRIV